MDIAPIDTNDIQLDQPQATSESASPQASQSGEIHPDDVMTNEEQYGGTGNTIKAGLHGVARGVLGPLAPLAAKHILHIPYTEQMGLEEAHPIAHGVGEAAGLIGGSMTGVGEGALMAKVGEAVGAATKLGKAGSYISRVGSSAAGQAAEMAVLQSGNEVAKMIMQDPAASSESAIANIGLATALGGAGGAFITGAISPLWKATAGPKLESFLTSFKDHVNGGNLHPPEEVMNAFKTLNMEPSEIMKAAMSGDVKAQTMAQNLYRAEHPEFMKHYAAMPEAIQKSVSESLGMPLEDLAHYSKAEGGNEAREAMINDIVSKYGATDAQYQAEREMAKTIKFADEEALHLGGNIVESAIKEIGTDSPYYKIYEDYAQRVMAKGDIAGLDTITKELNDNFSAAANWNEKNAWRNIKGHIDDFVEKQITNQAERIESEGLKGASKLGSQTIAERQALRSQYRQYSQVMQELTEHGGLGDFKGTGTLKSRLMNKLSPEQFLSKFSPRNNSEAIGFLQKEFPQAAEAIQKMESKNFLSSHVKTDTGQLAINYKTLNGAVEKGMKGSPEYMNYVLPNGSLEKIQAGKIINDSLSGINGVKNSGTPAGIAKMFSGLGAGAVGAIGWIAGHNPISGMLIGHMGQYISKSAPEAIQLSLLKLLGSDKPINAAGLKAAVNMIHNTIQGQNALTKGAQAVLKPGAQVLTSSQMPNRADRDKLDKLVTKAQETPDKTMHDLSDGHTGHYFPDHQANLTQNVATQAQYLAHIKPQPTRNSPLDREMPPSPAAMARYDRALDIANNPLVVLHHLKEGTIQATDLQDLKQMYPSYFNNVVQKISQEMSKQHGDVQIPYQTRMGLSLLLGTAVDSSMQPQSIIAAQPKPPQPQGQAPKDSKALGKMSSSYRTSSQTAEKDRSDRKK